MTRIGKISGYTLLSAQFDDEVDDEGSDDRDFKPFSIDYF